MLASWRNSEKLRQASADCRCFNIVSDGTKETDEAAQLKKKGTYEIRQAENIPIHAVEPTFLLLAYILPTVTVSH